MKIKNVSRFLTSIVIILLLTIILTLSLTNTAFSTVAQQYKTITVSSGDTLWNIAEEVKENSLNYSNKEIREIIYDLKQINNLKQSNLQVGQNLQVPM